MCRTGIVASYAGDKSIGGRDGESYPGGGMRVVIAIIIVMSAMYSLNARILDESLNCSANEWLNGDASFVLDQ